MSITSTLPTPTSAPAQNPGLPRRAGWPLRGGLLAIALIATASACVPTPFTFEETGVGGSGGDSSSAGGGEGGSISTSSGGGGSTTSSSGSSSSSTGSGMVNPCGAGAVCVDDVPVGWTGPDLLLVTAVGGGQKPPCPGGEQSEKFFSGPPVGQHGCTACSCTVNNGLCSAPQMTCWTGTTNCTGEVFGQWKSTSNGCIDGANPPVGADQPGSCMVTEGSSVVGQGNCSTMGGARINDPDWSFNVQACNPVLTGGAACGVGGSCEPVTEGQQICIRKAGTDACPAGWDVKRVESFIDVDDQRICTPCACNGITCAGGSYTVYEALGCNAAYANVVVNGGCVEVPNVSGTISMSVLPVLGNVVQNGCSGGGQPMGSFIPVEPVTFCCKN